MCHSDSDGHLSLLVETRTFLPAGTWVDNAMTGEASVEYYDGSKYVGDLVDGKFHGEGRFTWQDGSAYAGSWIQNSMHGIGYFHNNYTGTIASFRHP